MRRLITTAVIAIALVCSFVAGTTTVAHAADVAWGDRLTAVYV
jgi:hypothetical protein